MLFGPHRRRRADGVHTGWRSRSHTGSAVAAEAFLDQHAARHVDDGGDVLRAGGRRLRLQQLEYLISHNMLVCRLLTLVGACAAFVVRLAGLQIADHAALAGWLKAPRVLPSSRR
jgi:hypothetical protein